MFYVLDIRCQTVTMLRYSCQSVLNVLRSWWASSTFSAAYSFFMFRKCGPVIPLYIEDRIADQVHNVAVDSDMRENGFYTVLLVGNAVNSALPVTEA